MLSIQLVFLDPVIGVEKVLLGGFPIVSNHIVPFLESVGVEGQVVMLRPAFKDLKRLKSVCQSLLKLCEDHLLIRSYVEPALIQGRSL